MSEEFFPLKRIDVVKFLGDLKPKVSPKTAEYKTRYVKYLCFKLNIEEKDVPDEILHDIYLIKTYYGQCKSDIDRMIKKHEKFFNAAIKIKPVPIVPPPQVCTYYKLVFFIKVTCTDRSCKVV